MAAYGLGRPFIGRHDPAYRLFTSDSNTSLAAVDEFGRTRNLSHRRTGRVVLVVRSARRWYYPVGCLGRICVHRVCSWDAQRPPTSAGVLIRVNGASPIIGSAQQARIKQSPSEASIFGHIPFRFKRDNSTPSSRLDRPGLGRR